MKKTILLLSALLLTVFTYAWKPIFVGHRGSDRGFELHSRFCRWAD